MLVVGYVGAVGLGYLVRPEVAVIAVAIIGFSVTTIAGVLGAVHTRRASRSPRGGGLDAALPDMAKAFGWLLVCLVTFTVTDFFLGLFLAA